MELWSDMEEQDSDMGSSLYVIAAPMGSDVDMVVNGGEPEDIGMVADEMEEEGFTGTERENNDNHGVLPDGQCAMEDTLHAYVAKKLKNVRRGQVVKDVKYIREAFGYQVTV